jgi:hypothetical protein
MNERPLSDLISNRRWLRDNLPFPHVTASNVFNPSFHQELTSALNQILGLGFDEGKDRTRLSRSITGYDAYDFSLNEIDRGPFTIFLSRGWHDTLAALFDVEATGHINCGIHYHAPGSKDGWVHNDLNPGWFADIPSEDGIVTARHTLCSYTHSIRSDSGIRAIEVVRAVAMIYYFGNDANSAGGETGLYQTSDRHVREPDRMVRPIDNSLLVFECTPFSFHSFIGGNTNQRNSVIMWLHRSKADAVSRWGHTAIIDWPQPRE